MAHPLCPRCGCPAREMIGTAKVFVELDADGQPGRIVRSGGVTFTEEPLYRCSGKHTWRLAESYVPTK